MRRTNRGLLSIDPLYARLSHIERVRRQSSLSHGGGPHRTAGYL
jgi:hypothetical protein